MSASADDSDGAVENHGWRLYPVTGNNKRFHSSEYTGDTILRPKLVVTYELAE